MTVSWSDKFNPTPIIQRLQESRISNGTGRSNFEGFTYKECVAFLLHTLVFPNGIPENERRRILNQATMTLLDSQLTSHSLLEAINRLTDQYLQLPSPYHYSTIFHPTLITGLPSDLPTSLLPNSCKNEKTLLDASAKYSLPIHLPTTFMCLPVSPRARFTRLQILPWKLLTFKEVSGIGFSTGNTLPECLSDLKTL
jgi:hypothetical protein